MRRFKCTYCQEMIPWEIDNSELGLPADEGPEPGKIYPYNKCYCGWGKFVLYDTGDGVTRERTVEPMLPAKACTRERVDQAKYIKVPVEQIVPNVHQPRRFFEQKALLSLAESITQIGLLEDILVRPKGSQYELVLGERRWRAAQLAGLATISAKVVELDDEESRQIAIVENVQREDLTDVEEAFAFKKYIDSGLQQKEVGQRLGKLGDRVADKLQVLSSHYYTQYQEQRIKDLGEEIERLREQARKTGDKYHSAVVSSDELLRYLNDGYDVVVALSDDRIVVRRKA
ncbi:MAG: ParB/RepB/Spo0J family partition protein [Dehalococcoidales bacterium]|nr:ParB/RepB/Spo0J family partition protein [Dehalococcoidales bacterium]